MTTQTQPPDLLAPLLALVAKWREDAAKLRVLAARSQKRGDLTEADVRFANAQDADGYADELQAAIASLAAHRGEVAPFGYYIETVPPTAWQSTFTRAPEIAAMEEAAKANRVKVTLLYTAPPQAQAGAGDAFLADTWEGLGYTQFNGDRFVMFQRASDGLQLYCRQEFHEQAALALAALEASHEPE